MPNRRARAACAPSSPAPKGVPVSTFAIGEAGAANAALTAVAIIATGDELLADKLEQFRRDQTAAAQAMTLPV